MQEESQPRGNGSYQRIKEIVSEALDMEPPARLAFVEEACVDDAELRREVLSWLASDEAMDDGFIAKPVVPRRSESEDLADRQEIGPYRLLRRLGAGGMGVVYLAERRSDFDQKVALKLILRGLENDEIVRRFHHERQILANLQHPNIARLLDGARTDDNLPYFVMEYVEGVPIDVYCKKHDVSVAGRLALFRKVCEAVAFAHRNLVVHRDIKPANILVTENGIPKLLDFGIAKLLNSEAGDAKTGLLRPLTTEYASPEQLAYENVTTASDIYTLGVLLYELLVGQRPYAQQESNPQTLLEATRRQLPAAPSLAVDPTTGLRRRLQGDLDAIVLKALRVEPEERYSSVEQLLDDLERHRQRLPVLARRGSWTYKTSKFVRRHSLRLTVAAVSVGLLGSLGFARLESRRAEQEKAKKIQEAESAEAFGELLLNVFAEATPEKGDGVDSAYYEVGGRILATAAEQSEKDLEGKPLQLGIILGSLGRIYYSRGEYQKALPLLQRSEALRRQELGDDHPGLVVVLNNLAFNLRLLGDFQAAESKLREALRLQRLDPEGSPTKVALALNNLAGVEMELGRLAAAVEHYRESLGIKEAMAKDPEVETSPGDRRALAVGHVNLAAALTELDALPEAEMHLHRADELLTSLATSPGVDRQRASLLKNFGNLRLRQGNLESAQWMLNESLSIFERIYGPDSRQVAGVLCYMALVDQAEGRHDDASSKLQQVLAVQQKLYDEQHPEIGRTLTHLGVSQRALGDPQADETLRRALAMLQSTLPAGHPDIQFLSQVMRLSDLQ